MCTRFGPHVTTLPFMASHDSLVTVEGTSLRLLDIRQDSVRSFLCTHSIVRAKSGLCKVVYWPFCVAFGS
jgi:hypothetical protein